MNSSRLLKFTPLLLLSGCTIYVEDPGYTQEPPKPYWATGDHRINRDSSSFNQNEQINQGNAIVTENKTYKISLEMSKTEAKDIKISLYLVGCFDNKSKDSCTRSPINQSIDLSYTVNDGYTGELLDSKIVTTSNSSFEIHTKRNYPECMNVSVTNTKNMTIKSQNLNFNETRAVGC